MKVKKRKKSERTKAIERCDTLFSLIVRTRDRFTCQKEGCTCTNNKNVSCAHIWSRVNLKTRWNLENAVTMCFYHHIRWSHRKPCEFSEWIKKKIGEKKYYELRELSELDLKPIPLEEILEIEERLKLTLIEVKNKIDNQPF